MIRRFALRLRSLSAGEIVLLAEATVMLAVASLTIAVIPFRRIAALASRPPVAAPAAPASTEPLIAQVGWAIRACARRLPWRTLCFEQGLSAQWMLRRRGLATTLHYGVRRSADAQLAGHVWVRAGAIDVIGCENHREFGEIARFPPG